MSFPARALAPFAFATLASALVACRSGEVESQQTGSTQSASKPAPSAAAKPVPEKPKGLPAPEDVAAPPATAERTSSGLASVVLQKGTGTEHPQPQDKVKVHYTGWKKNGEMFDSSLDDGNPVEFGLNRVIKGWTEGLQLMVQGEKRRFWIPADLAYGDPPRRPGAPGGQLTFDVELLEITKAPPPPPPPKVPEDVAAPPASAKKTASGLRYKVLTPGKGKTHPTLKNRVKVHYSGWTPNGEMFDSSVTRGEPIVFGLGQVIKGWGEGVQLMVEGEKTRFWIPSNLAYGDNPPGGAPGGPLVFDVELIQIL